MPVLHLCVWGLGSLLKNGSIPGKYDPAVTGRDRIGRYFKFTRYNFVVFSFASFLFSQFDLF
jgi:hypothetical protein